MIVLAGNFFGSFRSKHNEFLALVNLDGGDKQPVLLAPVNHGFMAKRGCFELASVLQKERQVDRQQELGGQPSPI